MADSFLLVFPRTTQCNYYCRELLSGKRCALHEILYTVFIPLRPAGFIQDCNHFAAGFIGILLHTDAGSIRGRVLLEGGLNWNKYGILSF